MPRDGLLREACHRARIRATRWLAVTGKLLSRSNTGTRNIFFIIFVDGMFTSFIASPFTNTSHAPAPMRAISCVVHAGNAD